MQNTFAQYIIPLLEWLIPVWDWRFRRPVVKRQSAYQRVPLLNETTVWMSDIVRNSFNHAPCIEIQKIKIWVFGKLECFESKHVTLSDNQFWTKWCCKTDFISSKDLIRIKKFIKMSVSLDLQIKFLIQHISIIIKIDFE